MEVETVFIDEMTWADDEASASDSVGTRTVEYRLTAHLPRIQAGWFVLGSMRVERDLDPSVGAHALDIEPAAEAVAQHVVVWTRELVPVGEARAGGFLLPRLLTGAQFVDLEHPPGDAVRHHRGVHLVLRRQGAAVERGEPGGPAVKRAALVGPGLR